MRTPRDTNNLTVGIPDVGMKPLSERDENVNKKRHQGCATPLMVGMKPLSERDENR